MSIVEVILKLVLDVLIINDNIPIPNYIIDMLKELLPSTRCNYTGLYRQHYYNIIESIKILKRELQELANTPQDTSDITIQLKSVVIKNNNMEKRIKSMESKIQNIQTSYLDELNDNKKLKNENKELREKIDKLKREIKSRPNTDVMQDTIARTSSRNLSESWTNPGGAAIYTMANASNRMIYNPDIGVYEPENN
jgi:regulator of replication initiation timing